MADSKASALTMASALTGSELWAGVQGGLDRRLTASLLSAYVLTQLPIGTSGATLGLLNADLTVSGNNSYTGISTFTSFAGSIIRGGTSAIAYSNVSGTSLTPTLQNQSGTSSGAAVSSMATSGTATTSGSFIIGKRGDTANAAVASGSRIGDFGWSGADGTNVIGAAAIRCEASATFTTGLPYTRILFMPANGAAPAEAFRITSTAVICTPTFYPSTDNSVALGGASNRWSVVYAGTGTINTSDVREKQDFADLTDTADLLDAWADVRWQQFRFKAAVADKGDDARWHMGLVAQQVRDAIDARLGNGAAIRLGLVCHDTWDAQDEITRPVTAEREVEIDAGPRRRRRGRKDKRIEIETYETGAIEIVQPARPAGDRWGLRYDECFAVEAAYQRRRLARIEAHLGLTAAS